MKKCYGSGILIPSESTLNENIKLHNLTTKDIVSDYINLPLLPMGKITIKKIGVYNWNPTLRQTCGKINYGVFTNLNPIDYPEGKNSKCDYVLDDQVSPVVIIDNNNIKYKTPMIFWFPLVDIHDGIIIKQSLTGQKLLPKTIFIDNNTNFHGLSSKWMVELFNIVGIKIIESLQQQT